MHNWIWRRGADATKGAWLVHYTDNEGHKMLDELIATRNDRKAGENGRCGRMVVVCPRHGFVVPWIRSYFSVGNAIPLAIVEDPEGSWTEEDAEYCRKAVDFCGGTIVRFDGPRDKNLVLAHVAKAVGPKSWAWIDDTAEVSGNLDECFDFAEGRPGFVCAQFYYKGNTAPDSIDSRHPMEFGLKPGFGGKICWTSFMLFHGDANERLKDLAGDLPASGDAAFGYLYQTSDAWHEGFFDMSIMNWQSNVGDASDLSDSWSGKVVNYLPGKFGSHLASKSGSISAAQFEKDKSPEDDPADDGAVDAVFVIGTGSVDNNEELRYALRNLEKHCKFVRNVYISGFCPPWVDKSAVIHLNWPDRFSHAKDANIVDKLRHACEQRGIAKRILFCSDDQFQTRECTWEDFRPRYLRRYASNDRWYEERRRVWHTRLRNTLEREVKRRVSIGMDANEVFYYQPHIWMAIDRDKFIEYAKWSNYEKRTDTIIASGYYNFADADGVPDFDHEFMGANGNRHPKATHVAYHDGSEKAAMAILRTMFPGRSRFELPDRPNQKPESKTAAPKTVPARIEIVKSGDDPSAATEEELKELHAVMRRVRENPTWNPLLGEVSRAEELRLFGVRGWRTVWQDIVRRWRSATHDGAEDARVDEKRSDAAAKIVSRYMSDPEAMRTVRFGRQAAERAVPSFGRQMPRTAPVSIMGSLRDKVRSLRNRMK